jgi:thiol-disulfide isomerase/thioredoxin
MSGGSGPDNDGREERERPRATSRYSLWVGVAFLIVVAIATLNTLQTDEGGLLGADEAEAGSPLAEFAVPDLLEGPDADANVFQDDCETSASPCPAEDRRTPACSVEVPGVIRVCDYFDRPLVLSFWFTTPGDCPPTQDVIDRVAADYGRRVGFLSIAVRGDRAELQDIVRERGWAIDVGWDRDGAASNLYRVGLCPTVAFVLPGGILSEARVGTEELGEAEIRTAVDELLAASRRRAEATR